MNTYTDRANLDTEAPASNIILDFKHIINNEGVYKAQNDIVSEGVYFITLKNGDNLVTLLRDHVSKGKASLYPLNPSLWYDEKFTKINADIVFDVVPR